MERNKIRPDVISDTLMLLNNHFKIGKLATVTSSPSIYGKPRIYFQCAKENFSGIRSEPMAPVGLKEIDKILNAKSTSD